MKEEETTMYVTAYKGERRGEDWTTSGKKTLERKRRVTDVKVNEMEDGKEENTMEGGGDTRRGKTSENE